MITIKQSLSIQKPIEVTVNGSRTMLTKDDAMQMIRELANICSLITRQETANITTR